MMISRGVHVKHSAERGKFARARSKDWPSDGQIMPWGLRDVTRNAPRRVFCRTFARCKLKRCTMTRYGTCSYPVKTNTPLTKFNPCHTELPSCRKTTLKAFIQRSKQPVPGWQTVGNRVSKWARGTGALHCVCWSVEGGSLRHANSQPFMGIRRRSDPNGLKIFAMMYTRE